MKAFLNVCLAIVAIVTFAVSVSATTYWKIWALGIIPLYFAVYALVRINSKDFWGGKQWKIGTRI